MPASRGNYRHKKIVIAVALLVIGIIAVFAVASIYHLFSQVFAPATPSSIHFPADEAPHENFMEWWYYTGHMQGTNARSEQREYGFELTFFRTLLDKRLTPRYAAHYAITDLGRAKFQYDQRVGRSVTSTAPRVGFDLTLGDWHMQGANGSDRLIAKMDGYDIDLELSGVKPPVLHGNGGVIDYGLAGTSYYYSRPRMNISGALTDHGEVIPVSGEAWMDHQWGGFMPLGLLRWDWFSVQLANGTEYMIYAMRNGQDLPTSVVGTFIDKNGRAHDLRASDITVQATGAWTSPATKGVYPSGWNITVSSTETTLSITPKLKDQELVVGRSSGVAYWEGAVDVTGSVRKVPVVGRGYVELTGYATVPLEFENILVP